MPGDYDVLVYGQLFHDQANRLEIKVRGGRATAEYVSTRNELRRGDIPADSLDSLTRQLLYAAMSTHSSREEPHTDLSQALSHSSLTADRMVDYRIEVISRDSDHPLHLKTEPRQAISRRISWETAGVHGYAHTRFCQTVLRGVWDRLSQQPLTPELGEDFARRLRELADRASAPAAATSGSKRAATSLFAKLDEVSDDEVDLSKVEGLISVQLIVACRVKSALCDLERMGFRDAANELRFDTAENSRELLQRALEGQDLRLHLTAARMLTSNPTPENVDIARLDADAALKLARTRIERYAAGKPETVPFLWWVEPYLGLVFWQRDKGSVGPLAAALEKYRRTALEHDESLVTLVLLQKYLTEKSADERARLATDFVRLDRPNSTWVVDVGKRLMREGADPKLCQPLLEAKPHVREPISALETSRTWPISTRGR